MHETILKTVTVGIVAGLAVYWLTSKHHADESGRSAGPQDYKPVLGNINSIRRGRPSSACCNCCGLGVPENIAAPLASDYLCCDYGYGPPTSKWNLGVSIQVSCRGIELDSTVYREETATSFPHGLAGPDTTPRPARLTQQLTCHPNVPVVVDCTEII